MEPQRYIKWFLNLFLNQTNKTLWGFFHQEKKKTTKLFFSSGGPGVTAEVSSSERTFIYILLSTEYLIEKLEFSQSTLYIATHFVKRMEHSGHSVCEVRNITFFLFSRTLCRYEKYKWTLKFSNDFLVQAFDMQLCISELLSPVR